jgi:hypothetical protein
MPTDRSQSQVGSVSGRQIVPVDSGVCGALPIFEKIELDAHAGSREAIGFEGYGASGDETDGWDQNGLASAATPAISSVRVERGRHRGRTDLKVEAANVWMAYVWTARVAASRNAGRLWMVGDSCPRGSDAHCAGSGDLAGILRDLTAAGPKLKPR